MEHFWMLPLGHTTHSLQAKISEQWGVVSAVMATLSRWLRRFVFFVLSSHYIDLSPLIAIQYNQIPYRCFRPERYRFRGRRLQQQIETRPEDKVHRGNKEQHRNKQHEDKENVPVWTPFDCCLILIQKMCGFAINLMPLEPVPVWTPFDYCLILIKNKKIKNFN